MSFSSTGRIVEVFKNFYKLLFSFNDAILFVCVCIIYLSFFGITVYFLGLHDLFCLDEVSRFLQNRIIMMFSGINSLKVRNLKIFLIHLLQHNTYILWSVTYCLCISSSIPHLLKHYKQLVLCARIAFFLMALNRRLAYFVLLYV